MTDWQLLEADATERAALSGLPAALARCRGLAAPANALREVHRLDVGGRDFYLKCFHRTQRKNRWRNALTRPRCRLDAERELAIARALRARGIATARPIALGRGERGGSWYLCAALPGVSLRALLERGVRDAALARAAAEFCGSIFAHGVLLPDLSAEHVFVEPGDPPRFAVIDLHNGSLRTRPSRRALRRALAHLWRSVRDLPLAPRIALAFAVRMLRTAGWRERRALLAGLGPLATHARYQRPGKAAAYAARNPARTRAELACLRRVWPGAPGDRVLDAPCGAGRLAAPVRALGASWVGVDRAPAMLREAAAAAPGAALLAGDGARLPLRDRAVDGVVVFRFLHHLEPAAARAVLAEAARVARRWIVVSFFHPLAVHGLVRALRGGARARHSVTPRRLARWLDAHGFAPAGFAAQFPWLREFWVGAFVRQ